MTEQHDSLAQIPINSVLVGLFAESLNTMAKPGAQYPEFITIQGSPAVNTSSRSYKFKTAEVRQYLGNLYNVIHTMLESGFMPYKGTGVQNLNMELGKNFSSPNKPESMREAEQPVETLEPENQMEDTQDMESQESQPESTEEENSDEAVTELADEPSTANESKSSPGKGKSQKNKIMSGGRRMKRKLSLKKRK